MSSRTPEQVAREVLERTSIMVLSTVGAEGPWTTPVGYDADDNLVFTFLSMPETRHVRDIQANPRVSLAIFSADGDHGGNIGIQASGTARIVHGTRPGQWWQIAVTPDEVWAFDSREPAKQRRPVDRSRFARPRTV